MLYRVLIGLIPTVLIALFMTGAIPVGSVLRTPEYRSSAVRAAEGSDAKQEEGKPFRPRTPEGMVSQRIGVLSSDHIAMMEDNMQAAEEMQRVVAEMEEDSRLEARSPGWKPKAGGWGR